MIGEITTLEEAVSAFVTIASRKLREQECFTKSVNVFIQTNRFRDDLPQYYGCTTVFFDEAANDTMTICEAAITGLRKIFRKGYKYKRAGILFPEIIAAENVEHSLFVNDDNRKKRQKVMQVLDDINTSNTLADSVFVATHSPISKIVKQTSRSPLYSTSFDDMIVVKTK